MVTIIIIVKNDKRIADLLAKLDGIKKSEKLEILVVDASNGSLDYIKEQYRQVRWIYYKNTSNKRITIPEQRNLGIDESKGDILVFIDSDCKPEQDWLIELIAPIKNENEKIVAGKVLLSDVNSLHSKEFAKNEDKKYVDEAPTMNIAIHKSVFEAIGKFDCNFQCGEDVDLLWRATRKGYKIRYEQKAVIYHDLGNLYNELRRMYTYGAARVKLYRKHTYRLKYFLGNEFLTILYPLFFIFLPVTLFFPFYPLLATIFIVKNKSKNPFNPILLKTFYGLGIMKELILPNQFK